LGGLKATQGRGSFDWPRMNTRFEKRLVPSDRPEGTLVKKNKKGGEADLGEVVRLREGRVAGQKREREMVVKQD